MTVTIQPSDISGSVNAPASKSSMQRACAAGLLTKGSTRIFNAGKSNDDLAALDVIKKLGARVVENENGSLTIHSAGVIPAAAEINCGESGLGIRMFTPIAALSDREIIINGKGSLLSRPMDFFDKIFPQIGISIQSDNGRLPLKIKGPLRPVTIEVDGSLSSQFLTGLLMAYGAAGASNVSIHVKDLKSKPYIDLTLQVMEYFGVVVENRGYEEFYFKPEPSYYKPRTYTVEGDWSGGAFLLVAGAVAGKIVINGLDIASTQADKAILGALKSCGADIMVYNDEIEIGPAKLKSFHFDATDCPDLFPPLVALASYCEGTTTIKGVGRLAHKESNRALTLKDEFHKMGIEVILEEDNMQVTGGRVKGAIVHSHHDHRIAMSCAVAALKADGVTTIEEANAINKSYPGFFRHIQLLGGSLEISNSVEEEQQLRY